MCNTSSSWESNSVNFRCCLTSVENLSPICRFRYNLVLYRLLWCLWIRQQSRRKVRGFISFRAGVIGPRLGLNPKYDYFVSRNMEIDSALEYILNSQKLFYLHFYKFSSKKMERNCRVGYSANVCLLLKSTSLKLSHLWNLELNM